MREEKPTIDLRSIELGPDDFITIASLEDKPRTVVVVAEKVENGIARRRLIEFPEDPLLLSKLAQAIMEIADIQQISISKKRQHADVQFGPKYAGEVFRRTK